MDDQIEQNSNKNTAGIDASFRRSISLDERIVRLEKRSRRVEETILKQYGLDIQFVIYGLLMSKTVSKRRRKRLDD